MAKLEFVKAACIIGVFCAAAVVVSPAQTFTSLLSFGGLSLGLGPFVESNPAVGKAGYKINILGNNLKGTTSVTFNGTPATFAVISGTYIKATVPEGAATGTIEVTTPNGILSSNIAFQILP